MKKTDCDDCMKLLASFDDIPTTIERARAVWATQECNGTHTLDAWVANPTGATEGVAQGVWYTLEDQRRQTGIVEMD